jgi:hypothetical protein
MYSPDNENLATSTAVRCRSASALRVNLRDRSRLSGSSQRARYLRPARFECGSSDTPRPTDIYMRRKKRTTAAVAEVLEIPCGPDCLGARFNARGPLGD